LLPVPHAATATGRVAVARSIRVRRRMPTI
jgi:hypothetical protein